MLEFNCRFGDPETQPLLMRLEADVFDLLDATVSGRLDEVPVAWSPQSAVCVVMTAKGYPGPYEKRKVISGLDLAGEVPGVQVFHAGASKWNKDTVTSGGRVLGVTALGDDMAEAQQRAYQAVDLIDFEGAYCRRDIADKALAHTAG